MMIVIIGIGIGIGIGIWIGLDWIGLDCEMKGNRDVSVVDIYLSIYCDNTTRYCCVCVCVCVCIYGTDDG